jgi:protein-disulfide isomerase
VQAPQRRKDTRQPRVSTRTLAIGAAVVCLALVAAIAAILLVGKSKGSSSKATIVGGAETTALLRGIPQHGNVLGKPNAPVTIVEYGDLQCPICREFALNAYPRIITDYVRPGKAKIEFRGLTFIGPDSTPALQAALAAGAQNKAWNVIDLMYRNQGVENSGWVTEPVIRGIFAAVPGLDSARAQAARSSASVAAQIQQASNQANADAVKGTPTIFAGRTGGQLSQIQLQSLDASAVTPTLDRLLGQ